MAPFPFHKLPIELLLALFELLKESAGQSQIECYDVPFPMLLTHVNRNWRNAAIEAAYLWTSILIDTTQIHSVEIASLYLERSKACPVELTIVAGGPWDMALSCLERWRRLRIILYDESAAFFICDQLKNIIAPQLEVLEFSLLDSLGIIPSEFPGPILSSGTPRLHTWRMLGFPTGLLPKSLDQLRDLSFITSDFSISWTELQHVSKNLTRLSLEAQTVLGSPPIEFANLKTLNVRWPASLPAFTAPNLENLTLQELDSESMKAFFHSSKCPRLSTLILCLQWETETDPGLSFFLRHPLLKHIALISCSPEYNRKIFDPLTDPRSKAALKDLLPNLQSLSISADVWPTVQYLLADRISNGCTTVNRVTLPDTDETYAILSHLEIWLGDRNIRLEVVDESDHPMLVRGEESGWLREVYKDEDFPEDSDE